MGWVRFRDRDRAKTKNSNRNVVPMLLTKYVDPGTCLSRLVTVMLYFKL